MDRTKVRIIAILSFALVLGGAAFGVLYAEEARRIAKRDRMYQESLADLRERDRARQAYYESIAAQKDELRRQIAESQKTYEELIAKQPELIASQKQQVTKVTEKVVPVTTTQTVAKPSSSTSTKSS